MNGWVTEYIVVVRDGNLSQMGFVPAGLPIRSQPPLQFKYYSIFSTGRPPFGSIIAGWTDSLLWWAYNGFTLQLHSCRFTNHPLVLSQLASLQGSAQLTKTWPPNNFAVSIASSLMGFFTGPIFATVSRKIIRLVPWLIYTSRASNWVQCVPTRDPFKDSGICFCICSKGEDLPFQW